MHIGDIFTITIYASIDVVILSTFWGPPNETNASQQPDGLHKLRKCLLSGWVPLQDIDIIY
jgi:hypothetical protein